MKNSRPGPTPRWCSCRIPDDAEQRRGVSRRQVLGGLTATSALALAGWPGAAEAATAGKGGKDSVTITIMGTSDIHSHAVDWDYYKDAAYSDSAGNVVGLARVSSLVNQIRKDRGRDHTLLFDAGDTIQGTPLGFYYATVEPFTETGQTHPMALQMNAIGFDAVALGNHEFNYGLPLLDAWIEQMHAPVLAANAVHAGTDRPSVPPVHHQEDARPRAPADQGRAARPDQPGRRHLGQGQCLRQAGLPGSGRDGQAVGSQDPRRGRRRHGRQRARG